MTEEFVRVELRVRDMEVREFERDRASRGHWAVSEALGVTRKKVFVVSIQDPRRLAVRRAQRDRNEVKRRTFEVRKVHDVQRRWGIVSRETGW